MGSCALRTKQSNARQYLRSGSKTLIRRDRGTFHEEPESLHVHRRGKADRCLLDCCSNASVAPSDWYRCCDGTSHLPEIRSNLDVLSPEIPDPTFEIHFFDRLVSPPPRLARVN